MIEHLYESYESNFVDTLKEDNRLFGVEIEYSLVFKHNYEAVDDIKVTQKLLLDIANKMSLEKIIDVNSQKLIKLCSYPKDNNFCFTISPDYSTATLEISTNPETDLECLINNYVTLVNSVATIAYENELLIIGCGIHPFSTPHSKFLYHYNSRYSAIKRTNCPEVLCQSLHFTFKVAKDEVINHYTILNNIVPYLTILFSSSPYFLSTLTGYNSYRESIWYGNSLNDKRFGFGPNATTLKEYFDRLIQYPISRYIRNNKIVFLEDTLSFKNYCHTYHPTKNQLIDDFNVFESTVWSNIRIRNQIGGIEIRVFDSLPLNYAVSSIAFLRGLIANINSVSNILKYYSNDDLRSLHLHAIKYGFRNQLSETQQLLLHLINLSEEGLQSVRQYNCIPHLSLLRACVHKKENLSDKILKSTIEIKTEIERNHQIIDLLIAENSLNKTVAY